MMLHLVGTGIGAGMARAVLIKTSKKTGLFDFSNDIVEEGGEKELKDLKKTQ